MNKNNQVYKIFIRPSPKFKATENLKKAEFSAQNNDAWRSCRGGG